MPIRAKLSICSVFAVLVMAASLPVRSQAQGFPPLAPEDLKMTNEPKAPGAAAIILYREVDRYDGGRSMVVRESSYYRMKILTEEGRKYGNIEIPFLKGGDLPDPKDIQARTIKPDGSIVQFDGKVFEQSLLKTRGVKVLAKTFTLPALEPGCVIEYSYTVFMPRSYTSHWILSESLFTRQARFTLYPYGGNGLEPITLHQSWHNLPAYSKPTTQPDGSILMEVSDVPAFQIEDFMPPPNELKARVDFIYEAGRIENDVDLFWKDVGKKRNAQLEQFLSKHKSRR